MEDRLYHLSEDSQLMIGAVAVASLGGLVNWLRRARKKSWGTLAAAILTAAFAGFMSHFLTGWMGLDMHLQYAISGAAGYSGGVLLDTAAPMLLDLLKRKTMEHGETSGE